ncbi:MULTISPECIES: hypothetical protein [unclassified Yoonia]|uniref:hypothetical protein n=1 Tax=unclassified Yoonia TaxID=2629118 RepID=UPI002AFE088B|nr:MULTISPECIES: hypothetical protein [unclassified Yoonia]
MSIKAFAIAAVALASTASVASANSYFELPRAQDATSNLELGIVRAAGDGVIEIYSRTDGDKSVLLGTQTVRAGANTDVRVNTGAPVRSDVVAVLKIDGEIVATETYRIDR